MLRLKDILTLEELDEMDRIQKQMDEAQTTNEVRLLDHQLQRIIDHAKARFNKIDVPGSLLISDVLSKEKEAEFTLLIKELQISKDFHRLKVLAEGLLGLLNAEEREYYQNKIQVSFKGNEIINKNNIAIRPLLREVNSEPQSVINQRRRKIRKQKIADVQKKIQEIIYKPFE